MPKARPLEVKALLPLLMQDWPDEINEEGQVTRPGPVRLAEALIHALDEVRTSRTTYVAAVQLGKFLVGLGTFPGKKSAENYVLKQLETYGNVVSRGAVIPIETPEAFDERIKEVDAPLKKAG